MTNLPESILTRNQKKEFLKIVNDEGKDKLMVVEVRYDDECGNWRNSFAITGAIYENKYRSKRSLERSGCIHDEIAEYFPDLAKYIKWHLVSSDGPMDYFANTLYLAGDKDCFGKRKGEVSSYVTKLYFDGFPIQQNCSARLIRLIEQHQNEPEYFKSSTIIQVEHGPDKDGYEYKPQFTITGAGAKWYECEFSTRQEAEEYLTALSTLKYELRKIPVSWSEGKEPELEKARSAAIAPDATLEQLQNPKWLEDRLPALMQEFKAAVEELGFVY
jgi:hypothetical protein